VVLSESAAELATALLMVAGSLHPRIENVLSLPVLRERAPSSSQLCVRVHTVILTNYRLMIRSGGLESMMIIWLPPRRSRPPLTESGTFLRSLGLFGLSGSLSLLRALSLPLPPSLPRLCKQVSKWTADPPRTGLEPCGRSTEFEQSTYWFHDQALRSKPCRVLFAETAIGLRKPLRSRDSGAHVVEPRRR
jgi:hypothetical protein